MQQFVERWPLRSGTWFRDIPSERWRLAATSDGTAVHPALPMNDVGRLVGANRDTASGQWFPPDFNFSQRSGSPLHVTIPLLEPAWVPPFGAAAVTDPARPAARGLRQTPAPLDISPPARAGGPRDADAMLPALPAGRYRFAVHHFDAACPTVVALEPQRGDLLVLLPESKTWSPLVGRGATPPAAGPGNARGWRMEIVQEARGTVLYLPTAHGLAAVRPNLIGLAHAAEYAGGGPALGGPVAWDAAVWAPVAGEGRSVRLAAWPQRGRKPVVLPTDAPSPKHGFEAPVFDFLHVNWPSDEGQLVVRVDHDGEARAEWVAWPDGLRPVFAPGCPYLSASSAFWQLCRQGAGGPYAWVEMGTPAPEQIPVDVPRACTGHVVFEGVRRLEAEPWRPAARQEADASGEVLVPLLESAADGAVVGLRLRAPQGMAALLASREVQRAVLELHPKAGAAVAIGVFTTARPWLAAPFVHDAHLWLAHPELSRVPGWRWSS